MECIDNFLAKIKRHYPADYGLICRALELAQKQHKGQFRDSGEEYIVHPVGVADILAELGLDGETLAAGLLHDVVEDTKYPGDKIYEEFGEQIGAMVMGVTKLKNLVFRSKEEEQAENFRNMFIAIANDIRVLLIKLADRLYNMRTIGAKKPAETRPVYARETLEIYAPLASRLGLSYFKCELEDICLNVLHPDAYEMLVRDVSLKRAERQEIVDNVCGLLNKLLGGLYKRMEVSGRPKHYYSIYKKMTTQNRSFDQIYDLTAVRVIVETVEECYDALGRIHTLWKPIPGRFKDFIAVPKPNDYRSLHTTVMTNYGMPFEIQIRTFEMHRVAEYGIAAHWKYKEKRTDTTVLDSKIGWIRDVMDMQGELSGATEFLNSFKLDLYGGQVFVFTPKADVLALPEGSTPIDFAYSVHTNVGNRCISAKINSKIVPLATKLKTGDYVEIITSNTSKGPSRDWLKIVKTTSARAKIRAYFKKEMKEDNIRLGKEMLDAETKRKGFTAAQLFKPEYVERVMNKMSLMSLDDLYSAVGCGTITTGKVLVKLIELYKKDLPKPEPPKSGDATAITRYSGNSVNIRGNEGLLVKLARCCSPVPGDGIIAFISRGRGAVVHRTNCSNVKGLEKERLVEASWNEQASGFSARLRITADDKPGLLQKVLGIFSEQKMPIESVDARVVKQNTAVILISVIVTKTGDLDYLFRKIESMSEVNNVSRTAGGS